jgi:hexosaminidase
VYAVVGGPVGAKPRRAGRATIARLVTALLAALGVAALTPAPAALAQEPATAAAAPPVVIPALRQWSPSPGAFQLGAGSRIVVDASSLTADAMRLRDDVAAVSGLSLPVVLRRRPKAGDLLLSGGAPDAQLGSEGYRLVIGQRVEITAPSATGVFYGAQTVLQMLRLTADHRSLPRGAARDWPQQRERGFLIDAGRRYYSPDFIVQAIREMS